MHVIKTPKNITDKQKHDAGFIAFKMIPLVIFRTKMKYTKLKRPELWHFHISNKSLFL